MDNIPELLCDEREMNAAVARLACGIGKVLAPHPGDCALVGIHQQGVPLAEQIRNHLQKDFGFSPDFGTLDISMYRDDIGNRSRLPLIRETSIPFDVNASARTIWLMTAPSLYSISPVLKLTSVKPVTSEGIRSGVN